MKETRKILGSSFLKSIFSDHIGLTLNIVAKMNASAVFYLQGE